MVIFKKILYEHRKVAVEEHIRVFFVGLACKKKSFVHCRRRRISTFGSFTYSAKQNCALPWLITDQIQKFFRYILSQQKGTGHLAISRYCHFKMEKRQKLRGCICVRQLCMLLDNHYIK